MFWIQYYSIFISFFHLHFLHFCNLFFFLYWFIIFFFLLIYFIFFKTHVYSILLFIIFFLVLVVSKRISIVFFCINFIVDISLFLWNAVVTLVTNWTVCECSSKTDKRILLLCECSLWDNVWIHYHHVVIWSCDSRSTLYKQILLGCQS